MSDKTVEVIAAGYLSGEWEDFYVDDEETKFHFSIYTLNNVKEKNAEMKEVADELIAEGRDPGEYELEPEEEGIYEDDDGGYSVIVDDPELTPEICKSKIAELSERTGIEILLND